MGQSTNGLLWWGMAVEDDTPAHEAIHAAINGGDDDDDTDYYGDGREWLAANDLLGKVEFVDHCSIDYTMYGLAAPGTETTAWRGSPKVLGERLDPVLEGVEALIKAAELLGAEVPAQGFGWVLASMWS